MALELPLVMSVGEVQNRWDCLLSSGFSAMNTDTETPPEQYPVHRYCTRETLTLMLSYNGKPYTTVIYTL